MLIFNSLEEMKPYYNENTDTYEFIEKGKSIDVQFDFSINIEANIKARDIKAGDIKARDISAGNIIAGDINAGNINAWNIIAGNIKARDINAENINAWDINAGNIIAGDINAWDINFYAICGAYQTLKCKTIRGRRKNAKYFCLDNEIKFIKEW